MIKVLCFCIGIIFFLNAFGQDSTIIHIWPNSVPGEQEAKHPAVVMGNHKGGVTRLTDVTDPTITVFTPKFQDVSNAAVLVCQGGGYSYLTVNKEGYEIAHWLNKQGITTFVLEVGVMGFSAGGSLSARISTEYNKKIYNPVDKADQLSARPNFALLIYLLIGQSNMAGRAPIDLRTVVCR